MVKTAKPPVNRIATNGDHKTLGDQPVRVHELGTRTIMVWVVGESPLICHNWDAKTIKIIQDGQSGAAKIGKQPRKPEDEFNAARYLDDHGRDCVPARAFKGAMVTSATSLDDKKMSKVKLRQVMFIEGDLLPIVNAQGKPVAPVMRTDMVRLKSGSADVRYRPEYKDWRVLLSITYNARAISAEQVVNMLEIAGFSVGICEWRPEKNGNNGRFKCERKK